MRDIATTEDFIKEFSEYSRITQKDVRYLLQSLGSFIDKCVEEQVSFKTNVLELYFSDMKSRKTQLFGELPPTRKARVRLAHRFRANQKIQNKIYRPILEKKEKESVLTELD